MSFIEKHKAWLLPVLALGIGGVVYMNIQTFSGSKPPPEAAPAPVSTAPAPASHVAASAPASPVPAPQAPRPNPSPTTGSGNDLWADLQPFAQVPASLAQEQALEILARNAIDTESTSVLAPVVRPSRIQEPKPKLKSSDEKAVEDAKGIDPPDVDFLIHRSSGSRAWFDGQPYKTGQPLKDKPFTVGPIDQTSVVLQGPLGLTLQWTNPVHHSGKAPTSPPTSTEAP